MFINLGSSEHICLLLLLLVPLVLSLSSNSSVLKSCPPFSSDSPHHTVQRDFLLSLVE